MRLHDYDSLALCWNRFTRQLRRIKRFLRYDFQKNGFFRVTETVTEYTDARTSNQTHAANDTAQRGIHNWELQHAGSSMPK